MSGGGGEAALARLIEGYETHLMQFADNRSSRQWAAEAAGLRSPEAAALAAECTKEDAWAGEVMTPAPHHHLFQCRFNPPFTLIILFGGESVNLTPSFASSPVHISC